MLIRGEELVAIAAVMRKVVLTASVLIQGNSLSANPPRELLSSQFMLSKSAFIKTILHFVNSL
jgi:hypothetical protein